MENNVIQVGRRCLDLGRPAVMAIVNVTPDSFFAGSRTPGVEALRRRIRQVANEGADVIDVGGYSSRSGADDVSPEEELRRVSLALEIIREELPEAVVSIDTFRASVADGAMARYGTCIVNDIAAGELDPEIMAVAARYGAPYIAMHMRGTPADMQSRTAYRDIVGEVTDYLAGRLQAAREAGIRDVVLDPGFGFAKTTPQNYELLGGLERIVALGAPVLAGVSRKSMIYKVLETTPDESLNGTVALGWEALRRGARILRVHDVAPAVQEVKLFDYYSRYGRL